MNYSNECLMKNTTNTTSSAGLSLLMWCWAETVNVNRHTINLFQCVSARWKIHLNLTAVWNRKPGKNKRSAWRSAFFSPKRSDETKDRFLHSTSRSEWWKTKRARLSTRFRLSAWNLFSADQTRLAQIHSLQKLQFISQRCFPTGWQRASSQNLSRRSHIHTQTHTHTPHSQFYSDLTQWVLKPTETTSSLRMSGWTDTEQQRYCTTVDHTINDTLTWFIEIRSPPNSV